MRFAQDGGGDIKAKRPGLDLLPALRGVTAIYWLASLALGFVRLRGEGFSRRAVGDTLTVWYLEALVFLAVFGGAALLAGLLGRVRREPRRAPPIHPLGGTTLAALERGRHR